MITITGFGEPVDKSYRKMISGMDLFERNRAMAPAAPLRFKLLPRRKNTNMKLTDVEIVGETYWIPVPLAQDSTFTLERIQKAWDDDASVQANRKTLTMTWRADIRTPGLPPDTRRLGDLRLECEVGMEAGLISNVRGIGALFGVGPSHCNSLKPRYLFFAEKPVFGVTLTAGGRTATLPGFMLYASALDRPMSKRELAHCDCEVLLDRAYFVPLGDRSWPDDTLVEFDYMDDNRVAAASQPTANAVALRAHSAIAVGKSTKADVSAALGKPMAVPFETGFEVWAYNFKEPLKPAPTRARSRDLEKEPPTRETELMILFTPAGIATKTRFSPDVVTVPD